MRLNPRIIPFLAILLVNSFTNAAATSTTTDVTVASTSVATTQSSADTVTTGTPGSTVSDSTATTNQVSTVSDSGNTVTTQLTTEQPMVYSTVKISNDVSPLDAKLILQQAVQLNQQIIDLNTFLINAKNYTDPNNSPLFGQLQDISNQLVVKNATLQSYISQLSSLNTDQSQIDTRVNSATNTFVCFSGSNCVTDIPTTASPTTPGPTQQPTPCDPKTLTATDTAQLFQLGVSPNINCSSSINALNPNYNITMTVDVVITGYGYLEVVETKTKKSTKFNGTTTGQSIVVFSQSDVNYFADSRSSIAFNITYKQTQLCTLACENEGVCKTTQSGVQYCECVKCRFSGDLCETAIIPCLAKQKKNCGESAKPNPTGICYSNGCFDQCFACACAPGAEIEGNPQKCNTTGTYPEPVAPTGEPVCATTPLFTTTQSIMTTSMGGTQQTTVTGGVTGGTQTTVVNTVDGTATTVTTVERSSTSVASSTTPNTTG